MRQTTVRHRRGTTLVELLLFIAIFAICSTVILSIFFASTEQRVRQKTIMNVEHSGMQLFQTVLRTIRTAERISYPAPGNTADVLVLQIATESINPTIFAAQNGELVAVQAETLQTLSTDIVTIDSFSVENTSVSDTHQSVRVSMTVSSVVPIPQQITYTRTLESTVTLYPNDSPEDHCPTPCSTPQCNAGNFEWQWCNEGSCDGTHGVSLTCTTTP